MVKKSAETENVSRKYDPEPYFGLLDLYFQKSKQVLVQHHIDSYNQFIHEIIPSILQSGENVIYEKISENRIIRFRLTFDDPRIGAPATDNDEELIYPSDALNKNLSYSAKYTATITQWQDTIDIITGKVESKKVSSEPDIPFARIPIMVGSNYCNTVLNPNNNRKFCKHSMGGYFILNGSEKVILSVESIIFRKPMVFTRRDANSLIYYVRVQSRPAQQFVGNMQTFVIRMKKDNSLVVTIPSFKEISVFTLMRALGLETDSDIVMSILDAKREKPMMNLLSILINAQNSPALTREEAMDVLMANIKHVKTYTDLDEEIKIQQKRKHLMRILTNNILPHVTSGTSDPQIDMLHKAHFIGYMVHKLLKCFLKGATEVEDYRGCDDRDSMINKRIELSGFLLGTLFDQFFKKMLGDCTKFLRSKNVIDEKKPLSIIGNIKPNSIDQGLSRALSTGNFNSQSRKGFSQMLQRLNHLHTISYMRRVITPTMDASNNKLTSPRNLHNTQYGTMCPFETPEGQKTGIIKNLSMLANITIHMNEQIDKIQEFLHGKIMTLESINIARLHSYVKVFLNGNWIGVTDNIIEIHSTLRKLRFRGELEKTVSLIHNYMDREFHIYTEGGRLIRPYLTVTDNQLNFKPEMLEKVTTWYELLNKYPEIIEYVDKEEEQSMMLAIFPMDVEEAHKTMSLPPPRKASDIDKINRTNRYDGHVYCRYSHCEIQPSMILGLVSSNIPFPNFNHGPRGIFQYNQARQCMGIYASDYRERIDISYILYHPQIPLVNSRAAKYTGTQIFPSGENAIVAVASYTGCCVPVTAKSVASSNCKELHCQTDRESPNTYSKFQKLMFNMYIKRIVSLFEY